MDSEKNKVEGYGMYIVTFVILSILTLLAVWLTQVRFTSSLLIGMILVIAAIQAIIVLFYNMHLKFHEPILTIFIGVISSLIILTIIITMLDFAYR